MIKYRQYYTQIIPKFAPYKSPIKRFSLSPTSVEVGDIVELHHSVLGIVSFCGLNKFDVTDLSGRKHITSLNQLRFALTPASHLTPEAVSSAAGHAKALVPSLMPYSNVVYAKFAQNNGLNALDFEAACDIIFAAKYKEQPNPSVAQVLAVYFMLSFHCSDFVRYGSSPFAAVGLSPLRSTGANPYLGLVSAAYQRPTGAPVRAQNSAIKASYFDRDIGFSLETMFDRFLVKIYLPIIPWRSTLGPNSAVALRGITIPGRPLVDLPLQKKFGLQKGSLSSCVVVSALVNPWNSEVIEKNVQLTQVEGHHIKHDFFSQNSLFDRKRLQEFNNLRTIFNAHAGENPQRADFEQCLVRPQHLLARQARHLASVWGGEWAAAQNIDLCYLRKERVKPYEEINDENAVDTELLTDFPGPYEQLNSAPVYAPLGYVFDSSISAVNQHLIVNHLRGSDKPLSLHHVSHSPVSEVYRRHVLPNKQLATILWQKARTFDKYRQIEKLINEKQPPPLMFRCTVYDDAKKGDIVEAYCIDLQQNIQVQATMPLYTGDSVVCSKVLEVNPKEETLVLCM